MSRNVLIVSWQVFQVLCRFNSHCLDATIGRGTCVTFEVAIFRIGFVAWCNSSRASTSPLISGASVNISGVVMKSSNGISDLAVIAVWQPAALQLSLNSIKPRLIYTLRIQLELSVQYIFSLSPIETKIFYSTIILHHVIYFVITIIIYFI